MKGVVHEFGKAFTFRLYIDLSQTWNSSLLAIEKKIIETNKAI